MGTAQAPYGCKGLVTCEESDTGPAWNARMPHSNTASTIVGTDGTTPPAFALLTRTHGSHRARNAPRPAPPPRNSA